MKARQLILAAAILATGLLAACGGDDSDDTTSAATAGTTAAAAPAGASADIRLLSPADASAFLEATPEAVLVDVRTPAEYAEGYLEGATLIDLSAPTFTEEVGALDRDGTYVVYCRSGNRSGQAVEIMRGLGFTDVVDVDGGIVAWQAAGLPVVTG